MMTRRSIGHTKKSKQERITVECCSHANRIDAAMKTEIPE